ncbi:MAG TPA: polysaccharide deacetylase family protein [Methylomirabilota bacterium]|jgi:peptidoglycan/xylan/chitin deacetylase (PgdA/CDA1 family)|nr:polysaccharide deacetylase family protein [Methylomirabilota bacterium]
MILQVATEHGVRALRKLISIPVRKALGTITHVATQDPVAALTFDDGPHPEFTPYLLDILEKYQARATFFMLGEAAQKQLELVRRIAAAGHVIGNHSWDHPSFPLITSRERRMQIRACEQVLAPYARRLFRPPYGQQSIASHLDVLRLRYHVVTWNLEVGDWWDRDVDRMASLLIEQIQPGSIVALHDALRRAPRSEREPALSREPCENREYMLAAVALCLKELSGQYRFITVTELLRCGRPQRSHWYTAIPPAN